VSAKRFVRRRSAVATHNVDFAARMPYRQREIIEDIVQARIEVPNVPGPMIAQEIIELGERIGNVQVAPAVNSIHPLPGVRVVKQQEMLLARLRRQPLCGNIVRLANSIARRDQQKKCSRNPQTPGNPFRHEHSSPSE
jgi:hypothetical protein